MQDMIVGACDLKIIISSMLIALFTLSMLRAIFKTFKQQLHAFTRVSSSFIDFEAYLKALIHFLKVPLGKVLFKVLLIFYAFHRLLLTSTFKLLSRSTISK